MRKTRRSRRWVAAAMVLVFASYSVRMTPKIKKYGRWAAVPNWVLIASIHQIPEFVQNPDIEWEAISYGRSSSFQRAHGVLQWKARVGDLSWFDYQLVAWLARTEGEEGLCIKNDGRANGVQPRATAYLVLMESGIRRGKLGEFHSRWYRQLVSVKVITRPAWPEGYRVFGRPQILSAFGKYAKDPHLRVRFFDPTHGTSIFSPTSNGLPWKIEDLDFSGLQFQPPRFGRPSKLANIAWSDGMIELKPRDPSDNYADLQVTVTEYMGEGRELGEPETVIDRYQLSVPVARVRDIDQLVTVVSSQDIIDEIQRCVRAEGYWWYDLHGQRRIVLSMKLKDDPRIQRRRYTFGNDTITARRNSNGGLYGGAWWALEPTADGGWHLVHGWKLVSMYGGATEQSLLTSGDQPWRLLVSSNPEFCLRDLEATHVLDGGFSLQISWTMMPEDEW